jgi:formylglycine-generating enzyme required for sulfatase activity
MTKTILNLLLLGLISTHTHGQTTHQDFTESARGISFIMKAIPSGTFQMGCGTNDEPCSESNELVIQKPKTYLRHINSFYLAETETTWALYQQCILAKACRNNQLDGGDNGWGKKDRPMIEISWDDVTTEFIPWLNNITKKRYRLPTEAEWEYAARANTSTKYSWGPSIDCSKARYGYTSKECGTKASTDPVKTYAPNNFGLYDMQGNVWEFVQDCWAKDLPKIPTFADKTVCDEIVMKGGSWLNKPYYLKSAARYNHDRSYRESGDGFRLALDVKP